MSDKQKVIVSLKLVSENCTAALSALSSKNLDLHESANIPNHTLDVLQKDYGSLLSLLYATVTKLALSLKPSSPIYTASITPLKDMATHTSALAHCASLFDPQVHGATLAKEVVVTSSDIIEAIRGLVQTFLDVLVHDRNRSHSGQAGEEYMIRTASVHEHIDKARGSNGPSKDNLTAVRKKWKENQSSLEDGFNEVGEMLENDGRDDEDGWEELGLSSGQMNHKELERAKTVHTLLRLTTLLHKRIFVDILIPQNHSNVMLDALLTHSNTFLIASDDLVSTLYSPQNVAIILTELPSFEGAMGAMEKGLDTCLPLTQLEDDLQGLDISGENCVKKGGRDVRKWFDTCFKQIYKTLILLTNMLNQNPG